MKKPKKMYRYDVNWRLEKHVLSSTCCPQIVDRKPFFGTLWRCKHGPDDRSYYDMYGFSTMREAKLEALSNAKTEMYKIKTFIKSMEKSLKIFRKEKL